MTALNYGYPILGKYGEDALEIRICYEDGEILEYVAKNGIDITVAYASVGSSRIEPISENAPRILEFGYDKNFEEYVVNRLDIRIKKKPVSRVSLRSLNESYKILIYGIYS